MTKNQPAGGHDLARLLNSAHAYIEALPEPERQIALFAARDEPMWRIANEVGQSEGAVARTLDDIVAALTGRPQREVETGGLGSDTDPGVTGGYGDTGFGSLDSEPPLDSTKPPE